MRGAVKFLGLFGVIVSVSAAADPAPITWRTLQPGVELATVELDTKVKIGDNRLVIVRVDPKKAQLKLGLASAHDRRPRTAKEWCADEKLAVAINAGMFRDDGISNVGHLVDGAHVNSARWVDKYRTALAFGPKTAGVPAATMFDLDDAAERAKTAGYATVVQNLRLIKGVGGAGQSAWQDQPKRWSEAAVAFDKSARVLFLFSRTPYSMAEFNRLVLGLPLGIERAMHVEGGPEASLSIHTGGVDLDYFGSYETSFMEMDDNDHAWAIPNVLGVAR